MGLLGAGATALSHAVVDSPGVLADVSLDRPSILVLAVACAFFLAGGVMRLARWRISGEAHSALAGTALMVMGGLSLPLGGLAALFGAGREVSLVGPVSRTVAVLVVIALLVRALTAVDVSGVERPGRLLPGVFFVLSFLFLLLMVTQHLAPDTVTAAAVPVVAMSAVRVLAWFAVALLAACRAPELDWARRVAPLLVGMGFAESLRGLDLGRASTGTFAALLVCLAMAAMAARSALIDLEDAVCADEAGRTHLTQTLNRVSVEAVELTEWREQLTHDARNACAGLRAALSILEGHDSRIDAATRERVRLAAVQELGQIEHLLTRTLNEPCVPFDASGVVRCVAEAAWAVGARVSVQGLPVHALGRPGDLAAVLKNLLVNSQTHAPGSRVHLQVTADQHTVTVTCTDNGPGLLPEEAGRAFERGYRRRTSPGSGLGLYGARELMRDQGGDLTLLPTPTGASFALTLHRASVEKAQPRPIRVPAQRALSTARFDLSEIA